MPPHVRVLCSLLASILICGCASAPVGWGGKYKIVRADSRQVIIEYDSLITNISKVTKVAQEHASQYNKQAILEKDQGVRANGLIRWATFRLSVPFEIVHATSTQLTIEYDTALVDYRYVIVVARDYARERGKEALFESEGPTRADGEIKTVIFRLE